MPDYFSAQAADYARFRPHYPAALFEALAALAPARRLAWDCATGSGQSAVPLAEYFERVIATDASASQLAAAERHERVEYRVAIAESSGLDDGSVDLVNVSQALHWFDLDAFYAETRRVCVPSGALAVSSYDSVELETPALSRIISRFEHETLGAYWPDRRKLVGLALAEMPFPFDEVKLPRFELALEWTLSELIGYTRSWSATAAYTRAHGAAAARELESALEKDLSAEWGDASARRRVSWPFIVRAGIVAQ